MKECLIAFRNWELKSKFIRDGLEEKGFGNLDKIRAWDKMTLIIHAEFDPIPPYSEREALYDACPSRCKTFLKIPGANHNDIFIRGLEAYMKAVKILSEGIEG